MLVEGFLQLNHLKLFFKVLKTGYFKWAFHWVKQCDQELKHHNLLGQKTGNKNINRV